MDRAPSISRQLVIAVGVPLLLSFALTVVVLDDIFRDSALRALRARLEQEIVSLVTAAELTDVGRMDLRLPDPESQLTRRRSGQYAAVRAANGREIWLSPSLAGLPVNFGPPVGKGQASFFTTTLADGTVLGVLNRGLEWEYAPGNQAELVFSAAEDMAGPDARLRQFRRKLCAWFGGLAILLLAVLVVLLRRVLRPVHRLEQEIAEVDSGQRAQLGGGYPRELAGITDSLNALLGSEQRRIRRYRDTLGNLAHSLKTPLAVIRTALAGDAGQRPGLDREIDRMAQIVDRQLQRAAMSGGATLGQVAVPVAPVIAELRVAMRKVHARKDLVIEAEVAAGAGFVGDRGDLLEILGNLLDNACKWCRSTVRVQARLDSVLPRARCLTIRVEDDGPGIAPDNRRRVLNRGVRADERAPGHGLGLAMVADTVALYGGELLISESPSLHGACLHLALPGRALEPGVITS